MAKNKDIDFNGTYITLDWATEETLQKIENSGVASAKLLTGILKNINNSEKTNKLIANAMKKVDISLSSIDSEQKHRTRLEQRFHDLEERREAKKKEREENRNKIFSDMKRDLTRSFQHDIGTIDGAFSSINSVLDSIKSVTSSIPLLGILFSGIASAIGFVVGQMQVFSKSIIDLADSGAAFGVELINLRKYSDAAAMSMEDFTKLISENTESFRGLGLSSNNYLKLVSEELNSFLKKAGEDFNYFGMSITELNQVLLDEMRIRQKSGQLLGNSQLNLTDSLNELLYQTSAMAKLTGQSRREMLTGRMEVMNDSVVSSYYATLTEKQKNAFNSIITNFGGIFTKDMTDSLVSSLATGIDIEVFLKDMTGYTTSVLGQDFLNVLKLAQNMIVSGRSTDQDIAELVSAISNLNINESQMLYLRGLSKAGNNESANRALSVVESLRPFLQGLTPEQSADAIAKVLQEIKDTGVIALPAELQRFSNTLKTSFAMSASDVAGMLGVDYDTLFNKTVETLQKTGDIFRDDDGNSISAQEAAKNQINKLIDSIDTDDLLFRILESINGMWNWFQTVWPSSFGGASATERQVSGFNEILNRARESINNISLGPGGDDQRSISEIKDNAIEEVLQYLRNNQDSRYEIAGDYGYTELEQARSINRFINSLIPLKKAINIYDTPDVANNENITYETEKLSQAVDKVIARWVSDEKLDQGIRNIIIESINTGEVIPPEVIRDIGERVMPNSLIDYNNFLKSFQEAIDKIDQGMNNLTTTVERGNHRLTNAFEEGPR